MGLDIFGTVRNRAAELVEFVAVVISNSPVKTTEHSAPHKTASEQLVVLCASFSQIYRSVHCVGYMRAND